MSRTWTRRLRALGLKGDVVRVTPTAGGCVNEAWTLDLEGGGRRFVKSAPAERIDVFTAEAEGLALIAGSGAVRVPEVVALGVDDVAMLVLEWLELVPARDPERLGRAVATLHRASAARFGGVSNGFIGATPQSNHDHDTWGRFWIEERMKPIGRLAMRRGMSGGFRRLWQVWLERGEACLDLETVTPSLVHGDLWVGNAASLPDGTPVLFDPAAHFAHREVDLAMTELFGGFGAAFWRGYDRTWRRDKGYTHRRDIYNLYHVLNHHVLFGGGYGRQAEAMVEALNRRC